MECMDYDIDYCNCAEQYQIKIIEILFLELYLFFYTISVFGFIIYKYNALEERFNNLYKNNSKLEHQYNKICHTDFSSSEESSEESSEKCIEEYEIDNINYVFSNIGYDN